MYGRCILKNKGFTLLEALGAFIVFVLLISVSYSLLIKAINLRQRQENLIKDAFILFKSKTPYKNSYIKPLKAKAYIYKYKHLKLIKFSQ